MIILIKNISLASLTIIYFSVCYGDTCHINGLSPEVLKNLSYTPPGNDLLSNEQDRKAWQYFVNTYETPVRNVQNWYNSIVDKASADAAAGSFNTKVLPILQKLTGRSAAMKEQVVAIPASPEMQQFILWRILSLQSRLLLIFMPMQDEEKMDGSTCYRGSSRLFDIVHGLTTTSALDISKFIESQHETKESIENTFKEPWADSPSLQE